MSQLTNVSTDHNNIRASRYKVAFYNNGRAEVKTVGLDRWGKVEGTRYAVKPFAAMT